MKPDLEEVFLNDSRAGSVKERDHLRSLSIMKPHAKAYLVLMVRARIQPFAKLHKSQT